MAAAAVTTWKGLGRPVACCRSAKAGSLAPGSHIAHPNAAASKRRQGARLVEKQPAALEGLQRSNDGTGYLDFPQMYNPELATLGVYLRGDSQNVLTVTAGGIGEQLLFFPVLEVLKEQNPEARIDVVCPPEAKPAYDLCPYVGRVWPFDMDGVTPDDYMDMVGKLKSYCYGKAVSGRAGGLGISAFLTMAGVRDKLMYVRPDGSGSMARLFSRGVIAPSSDIFSIGATAFDSLIEQGLNAKVPTLKAAVSEKSQGWAEKALADKNITKKSYILVHGLASSPQTSLAMLGDNDNLLPVAAWSSIIEQISAPVVVPVARADAAAGLPESATVFANPSFSQVAALVAASKIVVSTNTAVLHLARALGVPSIALFSSAETAARFVPDAADVTVITSPTGKLSGIPSSAVVDALKPKSSKKSDLAYA
eukprot:jgi/Chlat1/259/Chrsp1S03157